MKRAILGAVLLASIIMFAGNSFALTFRIVGEVSNQRHAYAYPGTPTNCYNCHSWPAGVSYSRNIHFDLKVVHDGYYNRPYRGGHYGEFRGFDNNRNYRSYGSVGADQNQDKSRRGRR